MPADAQVDEQARLVAELFEQHRTAVFAYLTRLSRDPELAEEVTQETFLKVYAARVRLAEIENRRAWIFRVATNTCLTALETESPVPLAALGDGGARGGSRSRRHTRCGGRTRRGGPGAGSAE